MRLLGEGWKARPRRNAAAARARKAGTQAPLPPNVLPLNAHRHSVKAWIDAATVNGGVLRGGDALKAYKRFAGRMAATMTGSELRSILEAIFPGAVEPRNSGYVVRGVQLRGGGLRERAAI
jgi:hypothetical protein